MTFISPDYVLGVIALTDHKLAYHTRRKHRYLLLALPLITFLQTPASDIMALSQQLKSIHLPDDTYRP